MQAAISARLSLARVERGPYLYRYIATGLEERKRRLMMHWRYGWLFTCWNRSDVK